MKQFCDLPLRKPCRYKTSYLMDVVGSQFCLAATFATGIPFRMKFVSRTFPTSAAFRTSDQPVPALLHAIAHVVQMRAWKQVVRTAATRFITMVKDVKTSRDGSKVHHPRQTVGTVQLFLKLDHSIAYGFGPSPEPAPILVNHHLCPESPLELEVKQREGFFSRVHAVNVNLVRAMRPLHTASSLALFSLNGRCVQP